METLLVSLRFQGSLRFPRLDEENFCHFLALARDTAAGVPFLYLIAKIVATSPSLNP